MGAMNASIAWRAALIQLVAVGVLFAALALALPHSFFKHWGWLVGPAAWILCSAVTARALALPIGRTLAGAVGAGIASAVAVLIGLHELGIVISIGLFAAWCGWIGGRGGEPAWS
jgi:hypothetical protein